ncbi:MAG TPA: hypothetical protein VGH87_07670 [Polyangiaceae bacterium]|jgi:hypothetical protein
MKWVIGSVAILAFACEPPAGKPVSIVDTSGPTPRGEACRDDVPDCIAACALRETRRMEFVDFYERRCAAVVLGKNPDKVELMPTPYVAATSDAGAPTQEFPPDSRGSLSLQPTPSTFDPNTMTRTGGTEPAECKAARMLRAQKRDREADMLSALCIAKGGDGGA